jgi:proteic killer suppression protein
MIRSFKHKGLKRLYEKDEASLIRAYLVSTVREVLTVLDAARSPLGLSLPSYHLHPLKGNRKRYWAAVTVRANWRIIFRFVGVHAYDVELLDYHRGSLRSCR